MTHKQFKGGDDNAIYPTPTPSCSVVQTLVAVQSDIIFMPCMEALDSLAQVASTRNQQAANPLVLEQQRVPGSAELKSFSSDVNFFDTDEYNYKQTHHMATFLQMDGSIPRSSVSGRSFTTAAQLFPAQPVPINPAPTGWLPEPTLFAPITQLATPHLPAAPTWPQDYLQTPFTCENQSYQTVSPLLCTVVVPSVVSCYLRQLSCVDERLL